MAKDATNRFVMDSLEGISWVDDDQSPDDDANFAFDESKHHRANDGTFGQGGGRRHNIKLPKTRRHLNIDEADAALQQMGYKLGKSYSIDNNKATVYDVTHPDGTVKRLSPKEIAKIIYDENVATFAVAWEEQKHPRGQPENKGQFAKGSGFGLHGTEHASPKTAGGPHTTGDLVSRFLEKASSGAMGLDPKIPKDAESIARFRQGVQRFQSACVQSAGKAVAAIGELAKKLTATPQHAEPLLADAEAYPDFLEHYTSATEAMEATFEMTGIGGHSAANAAQAASHIVTQAPSAIGHAVARAGHGLATATEQAAEVGLQAGSHIPAGNFALAGGAGAVQHFIIEQLPPLKKITEEYKGWLEETYGPRAAGSIMATGALLGLYARAYFPPLNFVPLVPIVGSLPGVALASVAKMTGLDKKLAAGIDLVNATGKQRMPKTWAAMEKTMRVTSKVSGAITHASQAAAAKVAGAATAGAKKVGGVIGQGLQAAASRPGFEGIAATFAADDGEESYGWQGTTPELEIELAAAFAQYIMQSYGQNLQQSEALVGLMPAPSPAQPTAGQ